MHTHGTTLDAVEASFVQQGDDVAEVDVTMTTMKMREKASPFRSRPGKVNGKHSSTRLENPSDFGGAPLTCVDRQVMQHHRSQNNVEVSMRKRQRLGNRVFESNVDASP